jgi:hypothetical protein
VQVPFEAAVMVVEHFTAAVAMYTQIAFTTERLHDIHVDVGEVWRVDDPQAIQIAPVSPVIFELH